MVIVVSVYLAIVLEGASAERAERRSAIEALHALRAEMESDDTEASLVLANQADHSAEYDALLAWLRSPESVPPDSFGTTLSAATSNNRTMFPRTSSWTTMVASDQLGALDAPTLVTDLASFYEHHNARIEYNGASYDEAVNDIVRNRIPFVWDPLDGQFMTDDPTVLRAFRSQIGGLRGWNRHHSGLLETWQVELRRVMARVDEYLEGSPGGA